MRSLGNDARNECNMRGTINRECSENSRTRKTELALTEILETCTGWTGATYLCTSSKTLQDTSLSRLKYVVIVIDYGFQLFNDTATNTSQTITVTLHVHVPRRYTILQTS